MVLILFLFPAAFETANLSPTSWCSLQLFPGHHTLLVFLLPCWLPFLSFLCLILLLLFIPTLNLRIPQSTVLFPFYTDIPVGFLPYNDFNRLYFSAPQINSLVLAVPQNSTLIHPDINLTSPIDGFLKKYLFIYLVLVAAHGLLSCGRRAP